MNDKPVAGLVTAAVIVPIVALCCLGPTVLASLVGGLVGWMGGLGSAEVAGAALAVGFVAYRLRGGRPAGVGRKDAPQPCGGAGPAHLHHRLPRAGPPQITEPLPSRHRQH